MWSNTGTLKYQAPEFFDVNIFLTNYLATTFT